MSEGLIQASRDDLDIAVVLAGGVCRHLAGGARGAGAVTRSLPSIPCSSTQEHDP
jgi:hypothetical protein